MKRVIDGKTYNTDTATLIARAAANIEDDYTGKPDESLEIYLYQTRGGAFFLHTHTETRRRNLEGEWREIERNEFDPMTASEAQHWVTASGYQVEVLSNVFDEPPEAAAEESPAATLYIRVPTSLKEQIEASASAEKLSINAWAMRCMESCLASRQSS